MSRRRPPRLKRNIRPAVDAKPLLTVFCEGKNTEPDYLREFARALGSGVVSVQLIKGAGVPRTLVEKAAEEKRKHARTMRRNSFAQADRFWVAFDCDEHPHLAEAMGLARDNNILVAYSNPCFEVWLLLHCDGVVVDGPIDRHEAQTKLEALLETYNAKVGKSPDFAELSGGYEHARAAAKTLRQRREEEGDPRGNPYTDFDFLTENIRTGCDPD